MIYSLSGTLIYTDQTTAVVECAGVGYKCTVTYNTLRELPKTGEQVRLLTHMTVREDSVDLYGFFTSDELDWFKRLTTVNGVGPKAGIAILSELSPQKLILAIASSDTKAITRANGVGAKIAQRIILELKDKVTKSMSAAEGGTVASLFDESKVNDSTLSEAIAALVALGYSQSEAAAAVSGQDLSKPVDEIIKNALKKLF
ncbi:MAG: Holliday junction branch migration protein RuvA [Acutalibacteraceae bacterium]|nr:Holliday junction branch migration protein RuvA [Acutalibacteraceae bacterium]